MTKRKIFVVFLWLTLIFSPMYSQVTIGTNEVPQKFSVLELISNDSLGLRLPQLYDDERNAISDAYGTNDEMMGLTIFNLTTKCVNVWNGTVWIEHCAPIVILPPIIWGTPPVKENAKEKTTKVKKKMIKK